MWNHVFLLLDALRTCKARCCCETCEVAFARGDFRPCDAKNTFKHVSHILDHVEGCWARPVHPVVYDADAVVDSADIPSLRSESESEDFA